MDNRLELQSQLEALLGSRNVYFQPPASVKLKYPAIVYSREDFVTEFANDGLYLHSPHYQIILIDPNPDSEYVEKILHLPYCRFERHYESDNLNHDVFRLYHC